MRGDLDWNPSRMRGDSVGFVSWRVSISPGGSEVRACWDLLLSGSSRFTGQVTPTTVRHRIPAVFGLEEQKGLGIW